MIVVVCLGLLAWLLEPERLRSEPVLHDAALLMLKVRQKGWVMDAAV